MGCNTSQEMKTKDAGAADNENEATENGKLNGDGSSVALSNGDAKKGSGKVNESKMQNGDSSVPDKAKICELDEMELGEDEAKAATKIQAAFRGHQVRSTIKKSDEDIEQQQQQQKTTSTTTTITTTSKTTKIHSNGIGSSATSTTKEMTTIKNGPIAAEVQPSKEELEAEFDPNDKELCDAALKIQSAFRGHLTRKTNNKDVAEEDVDIDAIAKKVAEELDIDLNDPELNKAATKIQASFRGHQSRKEVVAQ